MMHCLWLRFIAVSVLVLAAHIACAQEAYKLALSVWAEVQSSPAQITVRWADPVYAIETLEIRRRTNGVGNFTTLASLAIGDRAYTDTTVSVGSTYEYAVIAKFTAATGLDHATGYVLSSIARPLVENRGRLLFVQESAAASALASPLQSYFRDLAGDGWSVVPITVSASNTAAAVKAAITAAHQQAPSETGAILLFGRVPYPYSGRMAPDGHSQHIGANPADGYYGELASSWTDASDLGAPGTPFGRTNVAGDGRWDQNAFPAQLTVPVGRIDLRDMPSFGTENDLLERYIEKNHAYRHALTTYPRRGYVSSNWGDVGDQRANPAVRAYAPMFGTANITYQQRTSWSFRDTLRDNAYAFAFGTGAGDFDSASNTITTGDIARRGIRSPFIFLFGSYFYDTDFSNNLLRAALAQPDHGLASGWGVRPGWIFHPMGLGDTIGDCLVLTQNKIEAATFGSTAADHYWTGYESANSFNQAVWITLMGDPTLRLNPIAPPTAATAANNASALDLSWTASTDAGVIGYHIYRSSSQFSGYTRISPETPVAATTFTDPSPPAAPVWYQIRAIKLESTPSGTYYNSSQGLFVSTSAAVPAAVPANLTAAATAQTSVRLGWDYSGSDATHFAIERDTGSGFAQIGRTDGAESAWQDTSATSGISHTYRVRAVNNAGSGSFSASATVTPAATPPGAPTGLSAALNGAGRVLLAWQDPSGTATGYRVERKQASTGAWSEVATPTTPSWEQTGLTQGGITYFFRVRSSNADGLSAYSDEVRIQTLPATPLVADPFDDGFYWNGADLYDAQWNKRYQEMLLAVVPDQTLSPGAASNVLQIDQFTARTTQASHFMVPFTSTTLAVGEGLRLSLALRFTGAPRTNNSATGIAFSSTASGTYSGNAYHLQTSFGADNATNGVIRKDVSTQIINNDTGDVVLGSTFASQNLGTTRHSIVFEIYRSGTDQIDVRYQLDGGDIILRSDTSSIHTTFQSAVFRYFFTSGTEKLRLDDVQVVKVTAPLAAPAAPTGLSATSSTPGQVQLAWTDAATTETGYRIERSTSATTGFTPIAWLNAGSTSYTDTGLPENATYYYRVVASYYTADASATSSAVVVAATNPVLPEVTVAASDASASETGPDTGTFTLTRTGSTTNPLTVYFTTSGTATSGSDYTALPASLVIPAGQSSATLTVTPIDDSLVEAAPSETIVLTLTTDPAYSVGSTSSATVTLTDNDAFATTPVANIALAVASDTSLTLSWTDNFETNTKYRVRRSTNADMSGSTGFDVSDPDATSYTFTGLTAGTPYYIQIRAEKSTTPTATSPWSSTISATPSSANAWIRQNFALNAAPASGDAAWAADPDGDGASNLLEYALGGDPSQSGTGILPVISRTPTPGSSLQITFQRSRADITYVVQVSSDLATWNNLATNPGTVGESVTVTDTADLTIEHRRFLRLRVTIP